MKPRLISRIVLVFSFITIIILAPRHCLCRQGTDDPKLAALRQQGYKTQLSDFVAPVPKDFSERAKQVIIPNSGHMDPSRPISYLDDSDLMRPVGKNGAQVIWKEEHLFNPDGFVQYSYRYGADSIKDVWPILRDSLDDARSDLEAPQKALLAGPFQFDLDYTKGGDLLLPHLASLRYLSKMFTARTILALHDHDAKSAWTNLLAATRVVTGWRTEPIEISQYVRCDCLGTIYNATWQAFQADEWSEGQLGQLQQEWESLDFFKSVPDAVAYAGLSDCAFYEYEKQSGTSTYNNQTATALFRFAMDRQTEIRRAMEAKTWLQMRELPGVTNPVTFDFPRSGMGRTAMRMIQRTMRMSFESKGVGLPGRIAEAEIRRRLIITAIAINRFHARHGQYPQSLTELVPEFVKTVPIDFMDGKPLRYRPTPDGHFLLYSVGLNCQDEEGLLVAKSDRPEPASFMRETFVAPQGDLVWPQPASDAGAANLVDQRKHEKEMKDAEVAARFAQQEAESLARYKRIMKELLSNPKYKKATWTFPENTPATTPKTLAYQGRPLTEVLVNTNTVGNHSLSLDEMFTLRQITTGEEPQIITYELPIRFDSLKDQNGKPDLDLILLMDSDPDDSYMNEPTASGVERATNGDCLLIWNTAFDKPRQHVLQAMLLVPWQPWYEQIHVKGPVLPFLSTNLCRFFESGSMYDDTGAYLDAELSESNAAYSIEIKSPSGQRLKTITGTATNAMIQSEWDLLDDNSHKYEGTEFNALYTITLPGSKASQTLNRGFAKLAPRPKSAVNKR